MTVEADTTEVMRAIAALRVFAEPETLAAWLDGTVAQWLTDRVDARFANEGDGVSGAWAELKDSTQSIREHAGFPPAHPINVRTGAMKAWLLEHGSLERGPAGVTYLLPGSLDVAAGLLEKLKTAQQGRDDPETVPRPVIGLNENDYDAIIEMLLEYFTFITSSMGVSFS